MLDVTGLMDAEAKAAAREDRYLSLTARGPAVAFSYELSYAEGSEPSVHVSYVSPQAAELVHYPIEHWLHEPGVWFGMSHPDDRERVAQTTAHTWRTGEPWVVRYRMIRSDGTLIWLLDTGRLLDRDA